MANKNNGYDRTAALGSARKHLSTVLGYADVGPIRVPTQINLTEPHGFACLSMRFWGESHVAVEALIDGTLDKAALLAEGEAIEQWLAENPSPHLQGA